MQNKIKRMVLVVCMASALLLLTMGVVNTATSATCYDNNVKVVCTTSLVNPVQPNLAGCTWVSSNTIWCTRSDCDGDTYPNDACPNFPAGYNWQCDAAQGDTCNVKDCNDNNITVYPGAPEICDGLDNDCDVPAEIDEGAAPKTYYHDFDKDTFGDPADSIQACGVPDNFVENNLDCNDNDKTIYTGAPEICDGKDNDCDDQKDEGLPTNTYCADNDMDEFADLNNTKESCKPETDLMICPTDPADADCNDNNPNIKPFQEEIEFCFDLQDNDCDPSTLKDCKNSSCAANNPTACTKCNQVKTVCISSSADPITGTLPDCDGDTYIDDRLYPNPSLPAGYECNVTFGDCDDNDKGVNPGAQEICDNGKDDDCDGSTDEPDCVISGCKQDVVCTSTSGEISPVTLQDVTDADCDGCVPSEALCASGTTCTSGNCGDSDDNDPDVRECKSECKQDVVCTSTSGEISPVTVTDVTDGDCDGCVPSEGVCASGTTCTSGNCGDSDDSDRDVHECNSGCIITIKCKSASGVITETTETAPDADCDNYTPSEGVCPTSTTCSNCGDCNDDDNTVYPGATELCDSKDNDCDDTKDEGCNTTTTTSTNPPPSGGGGGGGGGSGSCIPQIFVTGYVGIATTESSKDFVIQNLCENTELQWNISPVTYTDGSGWISLIAPDKGTTKKSTVVTVFVKRDGLGEGSYQAQFTVNSNGGSALIVVRLENAPVPPPCLDDSECDDGTFCNGDEKCDAGNAFADQDGCLPGTPPCSAEQLCVEEPGQCWSIEMLEAQSLQRTLSRPLFFGKICTFLVLRPDTPNNFAPGKSTLSLIGPTDEASGVSINERQEPLEFFGFILVPVCIAKDATIGTWDVRIETEMADAEQPFIEIIEESFDVK
jgi:hypothetical protein